jgi:hypothetical protein
VGRLVFWILCRVQAEVSVANPSQAVEHGEENTFPHFVRATLANPRHAHDLCASLVDPIMGAALTKLQDGLSIGSHLGDLCVEAGIARPWASAYYARLLVTMHDASLLKGSGFVQLQCRALTNSKSTSKRLFAATFIREHGIRTVADDSEMLVPLLLGITDRSSFVRDECLACVTELLLSVSPVFLNSPQLRSLLSLALPHVSDILREPVQHRHTTAVVACCVELLCARSPLAPLPIVLWAGTPGARSDDMRVAMQALELAVAPGGRSVAEAVESVFSGPKGPKLRAQHASLLVELLAHHLDMMEFVLSQLSGLPRLLLDAEAVRWPRDAFLACCAALIHTESGLAALCDLLCAHQTDLVLEQQLVALLLQHRAAPARRAEHLLRVVAALPALAGQLMAALKSDMDERVWFRRKLSDSAYQQLLSLLAPTNNSPASSVSQLALALDALAVLRQCHRLLPARVAASFIMAASRADTSLDAMLQSQLQMLSCIQVFCTERLIAADEAEDASLLSALMTTVTLPSPHCHLSLRLAVHVSCARLAASLTPVLVHAHCLRVVDAEGGAPLAVQFCCQVLALCETLPTASVDCLALLKRWAGNATTQTATLGLVERLVRGVPELDVNPVARLAVALVVSSDQGLCPLLREAALGLAKACVVLPRMPLDWVTTVFDEIARRGEQGIRPEEPGVVAGLALLKQACRAVQAQPQQLAHVGHAIVAHDAALLAMVDNAALRKPDGGGGGWNLSVISQCMGAIQCLLQVEPHHSRFGHAVVSLSCDPAITSPELRKVILRVMRSMPHPVLIQGLKQLAQNPKKSPRWSIFAKLKLSTDPVSSPSSSPAGLRSPGGGGSSGALSAGGGGSSSDELTVTAPGDTALADLLAPILVRVSVTRTCRSCCALKAWCASCCATLPALCPTSCRRWLAATAASSCPMYGPCWRPASARAL